LGRLEQGDQFGDEFARLLRLQVASFFRDLTDDSLRLVETFFGTRLELTSGRPAELSGLLFTFGFRSVLFDRFGFFGAHLSGPFGALLFSGVTLGHIFTLLVLDGLTFHDIVFDFVLMISGLAERFVNGFTLFWTFTITNQRGVAKLDCLITGNFLVFNETRLGEGLFAFLLLLGLKVSGVGGMAFFTITMLASNGIIILGLFHHHHLVDATLPSGRDGPDVQGHLLFTTLSLGPGAEVSPGHGKGLSLVGSMMTMVVIMVSMVVISREGPVASVAVEGEDIQEILALALVLSCQNGRAGYQGQDKELCKTVHVEN